MATTCPSNSAGVVDADGFCTSHGNDCQDFRTWLQSEQATDSILNDEPDPAEQVAFDAAVANATHYLLMERQRSPHMVIYYPTKEAADHALDNSPFIDGLCAEDCLELVSVDTIPPEATLTSPDWEHVVPPEEDDESDDDGDETVTEASAAAPVVTERTAAFFCDPNTSTLLLSCTISRLIAATGIQRGLIDLSTLAGLAVAEAFQRAGLPYESIVFGQEDNYLPPMAEPHPVHNPLQAEDGHRFKALAAKEHPVEVAHLGGIDANIVLIPAMVGPNEGLIAFTTGTTIGAVYEQLAEGKVECMMIDTPERGLRRAADGAYQRRIIHLSGEG